MVTYAVCGWQDILNSSLGVFFCSGKFDANSNKSFIWLLLQTQEQAFVYMWLLFFWEDRITVDRKPCGQTPILFQCMHLWMLKILVQAMSLYCSALRCLLLQSNFHWTTVAKFFSLKAWTDQLVWYQIWLYSSISHTEIKIFQVMTTRLH